MDWKKLVPLSGVLAVAAIVASFLITGETPDGDEAAATVSAFWKDHDTDGQMTGAILALGAFLFLVFSTNLAGTIRRAEGDAGGASALAYAGGIVFSIGAAIFAGINFTLGDFGGDIDPVGAQTLNALGEDMFFPLQVGVIAFFLGSGIGIVKTGILPKWIGWLAVVAGIVGLLGPLGFFAFMFLGLWTLVVSVMLFARAETA
jgi:hypothetical protein